MPLYEYECQKCHTEFEKLVFSTSPEVQCPDCESAEVKRLLSVAAVKTASGFVASTGGGSCGGCSGGGHSCAGCK